jgi:hypothetical protein
MRERETREEEEQCSAGQVEIEFRVGCGGGRSRVPALLLENRLDLNAPIAPAEWFRPDWAHSRHAKRFQRLGTHAARAI